MIVVTGGAGFIGSNLAAALEAKGKRVTICDWFGHADKWKNVAKRNCDFIVAPEGMDEFLKIHGGNVEAIFHLGAISTTTETDVDLIVNTNIRLSCKLWQWAKDAAIPFIYASSAATYGDGSAGFKDDESPEGLAKLRPLNAYGWSKHAFDRWVVRERAGRASGGQCVGIKFFNVFGPNEYHKGNQRSVAHQAFPFAVRKESFSLFRSHNANYEDGGQLRDFVWVGDCVNVLLWLLERPKVSGLFNLGSGKARSFADLIVAVYQAADRAPLIRYKEMPEELRDKYQYFTEADMGKLRAAGYTAPFTSLEDGVRHYVEDYLMSADPYA